MQFQNLHNNKYILVILLLISLNLWFLVILTTSIGYVPPDVFYYIKQLPFFYWLGLFICVIVFAAVFFSPNSIFYNIIRFSTIIIFTLFLFGTQCFVYEKMPVFDAYLHTSWAIDVKNSASVNVPWHHVKEGPLPYIFYANLLNISSVGYYDLMKFYPIALLLCIQLSLLAIVRKLTNTPSAFLAPIVFLSLAWFMEFHVSRQSFAFFYYIFIWLVLVLIYSEAKEIFRWCCIAFFLILTVLLVHPGAIIFLGCNSIAIVFVTLYLAGRKKSCHKPILKNFRRLCIFAVLFLVLLCAGIFIILPLHGLVYAAEQIIINIGNLKGLSIGTMGPPTPSVGYATVNTIRMFEAIFQTFVGLLGLFFLFTVKKHKHFFLLSAWFVSCYFFIIYPLVNNGYLIERTFLFSLLPFSVIVASLTNTKNRISYGKTKKTICFFKKSFLTVVITCIFFFAFLLPITKNANDSFEHTPASTFSSYEFVFKNINGYILFLEFHEGPYIYAMKNYEEKGGVSDAKCMRDKVSRPSEAGFGYPYLSIDKTNIFGKKQIVFLNYATNYYVVREGICDFIEKFNDYECAVSEKFNRIYDSNQVRIYIS